MHRARRAMQCFKDLVALDVQSLRNFGHRLHRATTELGQERDPAPASAAPHDPRESVDLETREPVIATRLHSIRLADDGRGVHPSK